VALLALKSGIRGLFHDVTVPRAAYSGVSAGAARHDADYDDAEPPCWRGAGTVMARALAQASAENNGCRRRGHCAALRPLGSWQLRSVAMGEGEENPFLVLHFSRIDRCIHVISERITGNSRTSRSAGPMMGHTTPTRLIGG